MAHEVKNVHYGRLALVSHDVNPQYLDKTQQRNIQWAKPIVRPSFSSKMSESDSNSGRSYDSDDSEYNLSLATSTLAILKLKMMEI